MLVSLADELDRSAWLGELTLVREACALDCNAIEMLGEDLQAQVGEPAKLDELRARVGGSVPQVRSALQKLAKSGKVKITGERRGTRYLAR